MICWSSFSKHIALGPFKEKAKRVQHLHINANRLLGHVIIHTRRTQSLQIETVSLSKYILHHHIQVFDVSFKKLKSLSKLKAVCKTDRVPNQNHNMTDVTFSGDFGIMLYNDLLQM